MDTSSAASGKASDDARSQTYGRFLSDVSHEIRGPLNAIIGFAELLGDGAYGDLNDLQHAATDDILVAAQHLLQLISDIVDISRMETARLELHPDVISVAAAIAQAVLLTRGLATARPVTVQVDAPGDLATWADERRVQQVIINLLSNACKYSFPGGEVRVVAEADGEWAKVAVMDQGPGIAPEDHERIFDAFVVLQPGEASPGAGLGLSISRRLARAMGGELTVSSAPGQGSTFTVTLPRRAAP
jgi:signal transduction histidine kinase